MNWADSSQNKNTKGQRTHEETFNILSHKGNANQNITEILPHLYQDGYHQGNNNKYWWECKLVKPLWKLI
jgi:hypothetical protein